MFLQTIMTLANFVQWKWGMMHVRWISLIMAVSMLTTSTFGQIVWQKSRSKNVRSKLNFVLSLRGSTEWVHGIRDTSASLRILKNSSPKRKTEPSLEHNGIRAIIVPNVVCSSCCVELLKDREIQALVRSCRGRDPYLRLSCPTGMEAMSTYSMALAHHGRPHIFEEFFGLSEEESVSPFLTPSSRKWDAPLTLKAAAFSGLMLLLAFLLRIGNSSPFSILSRMQSPNCLPSKISFSLFSCDF